MWVEFVVGSRPSEGEIFLWVFRFSPLFRKQLSKFKFEQESVPYSAPNTCLLTLSNKVTHLFIYFILMWSFQVLWPGLFLKWRESNKNEDILWEEVRRIQEINTDLKSKAISLRR